MGRGIRYIRFDGHTMDLAAARQGGDMREGILPLCAMCGVELSLNPSEWDTDGGWYSIPRRIQGQGIRSVENCLLVCSKCYKILSETYLDADIPVAKLRCYRVGFGERPRKA